MLIIENDDIKRIAINVDHKTKLPEQLFIHVQRYTSGIK